MFRNLNFIVIAVGNLFFIIILLAAAVIDIKRRIIPNKLIIHGIIITFIIGVFYNLILEINSTPQTTNYFNLKSMILGLFLGMLPLLIINVILFLFSKKNSGSLSFGGGDVKLMSLGGLYLGAQYALSSYFYTSLSCIIILPLLLLTKKVERKDTIPFGPFLSFGLIVSLIDKTLSLH